MVRFFAAAIIFAGMTSVAHAQPATPPTNAPETNQPAAAAPADDTKDTISDKKVVPKGTKKPKFKTTKKDAQLKHFKKEENANKDEKRQNETTEEKDVR